MVEEGEATVEEAVGVETGTAETRAVRTEKKRERAAKRWAGVKAGVGT
jgi:hypothetical protein